MDPSQTKAITHFVRRTLGCKCPDEVFQSIARSHEQDAERQTPYTRLLIGNRLLIYVLDAEHTKKISAAVSTLATRGRAERDAGNFNRFRLVLATPYPTQVMADAQTCFAEAPGHDDRTHLHVIAADQLPDTLRQT